nr:hypothetical protein [Tanacetum cinerariifolium]
MIVMEKIAVVTVEDFLDSRKFESRRVVGVDDTQVVVDKLTRVAFVFQTEDTIARKNLSFVNLGKLTIGMAINLNDSGIGFDSRPTATDTRTTRTTDKVVGQPTPRPSLSIDVANMIVDQSFAQLYDDDAVSLCCLGILQLVILGVESRRVVPDWMLRLANDRVAWNKYPWGSYVWPTLYSQLRNANVKRWSPLYVAQPTNEDEMKTYSIFGYTWAFKTWILESFRVNAIMYFDRYNRYPRVTAWSKKKGRFLGYMVIPFFQGGPSSFKRHVNNSYFNMGTPPNLQTPMASQPGSYDWQRQTPEQSATQYWQLDISSEPGSYYSFGQVSSHMGRPNLQTTIETHHDVDGIFDQFPSKYKLTPFIEQPPTIILPKQRVNKTENKGKKANLSPLNLRGAFDDDNVEDNNVIFLGSQFIGNFLIYENVDPTK